MVSNGIITNRVKAGMAFLDGELGRGLWEKNIDPALLDVNSEKNCPAAQAFQVLYTEVLRRYNLSTGEVIRRGILVPLFLEKEERRDYEERVNGTWKALLSDRVRELELEKLQHQRREEAA